MDRIHYSGDSVLTGTDIAEALLDYAQALAQADASATIEIPILDERGQPARSALLIGPASQLITDTEDSDFDELTDPDLVTRMRNEATRLRHQGASTPTAQVSARPTDEPGQDFDF